MVGDKSAVNTGRDDPESFSLKLFVVQYIVNDVIIGQLGTPAVEGTGDPFRIRRCFARVCKTVWSPRW